MGYFANDPSEANAKFKSAYKAKFGDKAPQLATIGVDCYAGVHCAHELVTKAGGTDAKKCMSASEGLTFQTAAGPATMRGRQVDKSMFLADCKGTQFSVLKSFADVKSGGACKA
jgi:ABC-type branched-subunit amino acid transport system substrate-binding protein